jgi:hypothetical protein
MNRVLRVAVNLFLCAGIWYVGSTYIAPIVICWQNNGTWQSAEGTCLVGTYTLGSDTPPHQEDSGDVQGSMPPEAHTSTTPSVSPLIYNDRVHLVSPQLHETVASPLSVTGFARGTWFFEGSFPLLVVDSTNTIIGEGFATAEGEWMTEAYVPFQGKVPFNRVPTPDATNAKRTGALILKKDNPSGLPEHDDELRVPIVFN